MFLAGCDHHVDQAQKALEGEVGNQNHEGDHSGHLHAAHTVLELGDHEGDGARGGGCQERDRRNGHHGVDEQVGEHFRNGGHALRNEYVLDHAHTADTQGLADCLQILVHFSEGIGHHQVRGGQEVRHIGHDHDEDCSIDKGLLKGHGIG